MKLILAYPLALVLFFSAGTTVRAQDHGTVTWDKNQPSSPNQGNLFGSGSFTLDAGWTIDAMKMHAVPVNGGQVPNAVDCVRNNKTMTFTASMTGLTSGKQYNVYVIMSISKVGSGGQDIASKTVSVTIM